jgi:ERCC4-related helicase
MSTTPTHENATTHVYTQLRKWQTRILNQFGDTNEPLVSDLLVVDLIAAEGLGVVETNTIIDYDAVS